MASFDQAQLLFHHVFLPPKVPDKSDETVATDIFFEHVIKTAESFSKHLDVNQRAKWNVIVSSLRSWHDVNDQDGFSQDHAYEAIRNLNNDESLFLHIKAQNAAILIHKEKTGVVFESFEVSPTTNAVLKSPNALIRTFPARSVVVSTGAMSDRKFVKTAVEYLYKLSTESTHMSLESVVKAKVDVKEIRQSEHPKLVTQWFFAFLASKGRPHSSTVAVTKRIRDEVSWSDTLKPWRRSPTWLCIRVSLQLILARAFGSDEGKHIYKIFMLAFVSHVAKDLKKSMPLSLENMHIIRIKLVRRYAKLASSLQKPLRDMLMQTLRDLRDVMDNTWNTVQALDRRNIPRISMEQLDCDILLANSRGVLHEVQARHKKNKGFEPRDVDIKPSSSIYLDPAQLPDVSMFLQGGNDEIQVITTFNQWIECNLGSWAESVVPDGPTCTKLYHLIRRYFESCSTTLNRQPELMSIAILVMIELWVVLDKLAVRSNPLLGSFSPEIPTVIFSPLRLPQYAQMHRLCMVERYLRNRWADSVPENPSIFSDPCAKAFGVQQFDVSPSLKQLLASIEAKSARDKSLKLEEYHVTKSKYEMKLREIQTMECERKAINIRGQCRIVHDKECHKCKEVSEANKMSVYVYEEPLPSNSMLRKAVVFELQPGETFVAWRDATYLIAQDILNGSFAQGARIRCTLAKYYGLRSYHTLPDRRVGLASNKKSFHQSHYIKNEISSTIESTLFVPHGLEHRYYDAQKTNSWLSERESNPSLTKYCRPKLPAGPYSVLLETVQSTHHSQNGVIARQSKCPPSLGTHEFIAYGSMRAGEKLQWINLLRTLIVGDIDLNSASGVVLVEQLVNEVGTASENYDILRVTHGDIQSDRFCKEIQVSINAIIQRAEQNWKETNTLHSCLIVISRLVSLRNTFNDDIFHEGIFLIRRIRRTTLGWALELATKCFSLRNQEQSPSEVKEIQRRVLGAALIAKATWTVDGLPRRLLFGSRTDFEEYVAASILVFDYRKLCADDKDAMLHWMLLRDQVRSVECAQILKTLLPHVKLGASQGIRDCWSDLHVERNWTVYGGSFSHWITSKVVDSTRPVHFNLMTGELLVAGSPVSILPESYTQSAIYGQVFGGRAVDAVASDVPWMEFMTVGLISGNRVYFGRSGGDYIIQCARDGTLYEVVNRNVFRDDLPTTIIEKTQPWICISNGQIEFRQRGSQWQSSRADWLIQPSKGFGQAFSMKRRNQVLVDSTKSFGLTICKTFEGFESPNNLEICYEETKGLKVELPRYHLTFDLHSESGRFRCQELAAEIDSNQSIDTFYGLNSRLVLSSLNASKFDPKRLVLVPYGPLDISLSPHHVQIDVETKHCEVVDFFQYKVDSNLCRIDADGDLEAHLFKAYLHAVTSSCLPDGLTGRSGTEESIEALRDSITLTSVPISKRANEILEEVSQLTPVRKFYPDSNSKAVQTTYWHQSLPSLSQHDEFSEITTEIGTHSILANFLFDGDKEVVPEYSGDQELRVRAAGRTSMYLTFKGIRTHVSHDNDYAGRDRDNEQDLDEIYRITSCVNSWSVPTASLVVDLYAFMEPFGVVSGFGESFNPAGIADLLTIDISVYLPALIGFCFEARPEDAYTIAMQLSLIAFGNPKSIPIVNTLIAFAVYDPLKELGMPAASDYDLSVGSFVDECRIRSVLDCCQTIGTTARLQLQADADEEIDFLAELNMELEYQRKEVCAAVKKAWPHGKVFLPSTETLPNFVYADLQQAINDLYAAWRRNNSLRVLCLAYTAILRTLSTHFTPSSRSSLEVKKETYSAGKSPPHYPTLSKIFGQINHPEWRNQCYPSTVYNGSLLPQFEDTNEEKRVDSESTMAQMRLGELLDRMQHSRAVGISDAVGVLRSSLRSLKDNSTFSTKKVLLVQQDFLEREHKMMVEKVQHYLRALKEALKPDTEVDKGFEAAGLWPTPTPWTVLKLLTREERVVARRSHGYSVRICSDYLSQAESRSSTTLQIHR